MRGIGAGWYLDMLKNEHKKPCTTCVDSGAESDCVTRELVDGLEEWARRMRTELGGGP